MLWTYEDGDYNSSVSIGIDSDDIKYDAEYMNIFIEQLTGDVKWYVDRARALEKSYVKYHNNETFAGQMAEYSKRFIYEIQGDELHIKNLELKKDFLYACSNIEEKFKEQVDPSPKSRVSTRVLLKIKKDFGTYYAVIDTKGYEIECHAKRLVDMYGKWGVSTIPCYRRSMMTYEEFCGSGAFLDTCIKKIESFDQESCSVLNGKDFIGNAQTLQAKINNTAGVLDSMTVYQPNVAKNSVGLVSLSAMGSVKNNPLDALKKLLSTNKKSGSATITDSKYIESMKKIYGFSEEDARLLYEAYTKYNNSQGVSKWNKQSNIWGFFGNLAALFSDYSGDDIKFQFMGNLPPHQKALEFFEHIGIDGEKIKDIVVNQHKNCGENRDFAHECAIIAIMSSDTFFKAGDDIIDNPDALVGYKGDVYSGSMGPDDMKSDIAAVNIYYRMRFSNPRSDIFQEMIDYNQGTVDGSINEAEEFLSRYGTGSVDKKLERLKKEMNQKSFGTFIISQGVDEEVIEEYKIEFIDFLETKLNE